MKQDLITCPNCGCEFELSTTLTEQIRKDVHKELLGDIRKREKALSAEMKALQKRSEEIDTEVESQLQARVVEAEEKAAAKLREKHDEEMGDLKEALEERDSDLKDFRNRERELRKKARALEKAKEEADLEVERRLEKEREDIQKKAKDAAAEQQKLKDREKDKIIQDLREALEDAKRKAEQGSMQTQGEVLELELEEQLKRHFPHDEIKPVPKGIRGADVVHTVRNAAGRGCGTILWETKNTKTWSSKWTSKLKDDMTATRSNLGIIVSSVLPEDVRRFGFLDGIGVTDPACAIPMALILREQLIAIDDVREASVGKGEKMEFLYQYLTGTEFKHKIEGIIEAFTTLEAQVASERRAMERHWSERETQLTRVVKNTAGLYGDLRGIIGGQIPEIRVLKLEEPPPSQLPGAADSSDPDENGS